MTFCFISVDDVLHTLTGAMSLLRRCRVNAALTIQLFSQLFHFINMWLFNRLVTAPDSGLCSHYWGAIVRQQLGHIEAWAEKQGLELAADCHLSRIVQVSVLVINTSHIFVYSKRIFAYALLVENSMWTSIACVNQSWNAEVKTQNMFSIMLMFKLQVKLIVNTAVKFPFVRLSL